MLKSTNQVSYKNVQMFNKKRKRQEKFERNTVVLLFEAENTTAY